MLKKIISALAISLLAAILLALPASAGGSIKDYEYTVNSDGSVTITAYHGNGANVAIPDTLGGKPVREIGAGVFSGHTEIAGLYIYEGVSIIGASAFAGCTALTSLAAPASLTQIGDDAFSGCTSLSKIDFTGGLLKIGAGAFSGCTALKYVFLPEALTSVGAGAFSGCTSLEFVAATNASSSAIYGAGCFGGAKIYAFSGSPAEALASAEKLSFSAIAPLGSLNYSVYGSGIKINYCTSNAEAVFIPESIGGKKVTAVGESAFSAEAGRCAGTKIIVLPDSVKMLGNSAFAGSAALEYVRLPRALDGDISQNMFRNCASLKSVSVPAGVERIGSDAFSGCTSLKKVKLPASVRYISSEAFRNCSSLSELIFDGSEPACDYKNTLASMVSFAGVGDMTVYIKSGTAWNLTDGKWYPNGTQYDYVGYPVVTRTCDNFYVEKIIARISCAHDGISEFLCPFCGQNYTETYPATPHHFVSTGMVDGIETFRCTDCSASYVRYHMAYAVIKPVINPDNPRGSMMSSVEITFRGMTLKPDTDYMYTETYNATYKRVELVFTGTGEYTGVRKLAYSLSDSRWLTAYTVTVTGASGGGSYYPNDLIELTANTPPEGMEAGAWSITAGVNFMSKGQLGASFIMPSKDVNVTLTFKEIPVTTPPETDPPITTPPVTEPPVTQPPVTEPPATDPVTVPPVTEPVTTDPFDDTKIGREIIKKGIIWGSILFISLAALTAVSIIFFKKDKNQE